MKNKAKTWKVLLLLAFLRISSPTQAQQLGIGGIINHTATGILVTYTPKWEKRWTLDLGLRYFAKINLIGNNEDMFSYYQQGYTKSYWEKFGGNIRISRKLFSYKMLRLDFMTNLLVTCESRMERYPIHEYDPVSGSKKSIIGFDESYYKASPAIELTIGPQLFIQLSNSITLSGALGWGIIYMHHNHTGWSYQYNAPITTYDSFSPWLEWKRGAFEAVGFDRLPMLSAGIKYRLK